MAYYMNHFSEKTYRAFSASQRQIVGFPDSQMQRAENIHPGDKLICYVTKLSRIAGILEVESERYVDRSPIFASEDDPYVVRFRVRPLVWLELENAIPILDDDCWELLSFTRGREKTASAWAGMVRMSLRQFKDEDGAALEALLFRQTTEKKVYSLRGNYRQTQRNSTDGSSVESESGEAARHSEHARIQAMLSRIGECMHMQIWLPNADRGKVLRIWQPELRSTLLSELPFRYDRKTMRIVENIDVIWVERTAIVRAFEVEHSTAIYSGILRMADMIALQPNLSIRAHIVAPLARKGQVMREITRPAFSQMAGRRALREVCSYLSYDAIEALANERNLRYLRANVVDEYAECAQEDE